MVFRLCDGSSLPCRICHVRACVREDVVGKRAQAGTRSRAWANVIRETPACAENSDFLSEVRTILLLAGGANSTDRPFKAQVFIPGA